MSLTPGARLGPYEIVSPLGAGGMGEVYRATDAKLGRDVAIKVLPERLAEDPEALVVGAVDLAHAARAELRHDLVVSQAGSGGKMHRPEYDRNEGPEESLARMARNPSLP